MKDEIFEHKGYAGSVEHSLDDEVLHGKVLFIDDLVNYEGETIAQLRSAFIEAVDHYLERCQEEGLLPKNLAAGHLMRGLPRNYTRLA
jgi:predicted HicB family RNase H-like nuclease